MSGVEYELPAAGAPWPELDRRFLEADRRVVPPFPLEIIPEPWRPWIEGHAQASTCLDYIAQAQLAAVSAVCGSRFVVDVTAHWREPLVLWQALVGGPSTGKTPAMVAARRLLGSVTAPPDEGGQIELRPGESPLTGWLLHRGISFWYDDLDVWLAKRSRDPDERALAVASWTGDQSHRGDDPIDVGRQLLRYPVARFGTLHAGRLAETLSFEESLLCRLLYCWPLPRLEAWLAVVRLEGGDIRPLLQRLVDLPGEVSEPAALRLHEKAVARLEEMVPRLRSLMHGTEGLQAAWIGKAAGNIVRLAGLLSLMDWAAGEGEEPPTTVEVEPLQRAEALWSEYFWPHAQAVFGQVPLTLTERRVQRVGRWLRRTRPDVVSREEVRREALSQAVDADSAESCIERLEQHGVLRLLEPHVGRSGRPRRRWAVNPALWAG